MALMLIMDWNHIVFIWKGIGWFNFRSGWLNKIQEINVIYQNRTDYSYLKQYFQGWNIALSHFYIFFNTIFCTRIIVKFTDRKSLN